MPSLSNPARRYLLLSMALLSAFTGIYISRNWLMSRYQQYRVLHADPALLARLGRHVVLGYRSDEELDQLLQRRALGGIFVTRRNLVGMDDARAMQAVHERLAHSPAADSLLVMADQEGGDVSRLTPPLPAQPALRELLEQAPAASHEQLVRTYARTQATGMRAMGFNMNLAPLADLSEGVAYQDDRYTRIYRRALSSEPLTVSRMAGWYCDELARNGIRCTLKHFPGLGRVQLDTHLGSANLSLTRAELEGREWLPFRQLMRQGMPVMLSHVRVPALDDDVPASLSAKIATGLLRRDWHYDGLLITDDFSMYAIMDRDGGVGPAAVQALNAGVDLILITRDPDAYYAVMDALLKAAEEGRLDETQLRTSEQRLDQELDWHRKAGAGR